MIKTKDFQTKNLCWWALILAAVCGIITVGIVVLRNGGIFTYYGDYNCQQIAFYMHTHELVTNGQIGWDWNTDLGVNFIGAYSFYLLFSPFFWLTLPFDTAMVPYLMAPLFVLKFAASAFTAYFYVARFVKDKRYAVIGGLLYAFSGYCIYNVFFNHFLDVVAFFPLILIGLEMLITEDKHGPFAAAVALNAIVNYWFFIGEVVFVVLYFFIRITDKNISRKFRCFLYVALESVIGLCVAAVAVLPSVLAITENPRTGVDNFINGWSLWLYYSEQRVPAIITSFFFPPDMPSKQNMFTGQGAQWASMAGWLPLFGMTGVLAYVRSVKNSWLKKMIIACTVFALVPALNSLFILFNHSYYARWFYMFELVLILATVKALELPGEDESHEEIDYKKGLIPSFCFVIGLTLILFLTPVHYNDGNWEMGLLYDDGWFILSASFAIVCLGFSLLLWLVKNRKFYKNLLVLMTAFICALYGMAYINLGYTFAGDHDEIIEDAVGLAEEMELPSEGEAFARADFYECFENMGLYWNIPSIRCFHSVVTPSIMEFYPTVDVTRDVSSKPEFDLYELRALLSVRYLYADADEASEESVLCQGFNYYKTENGYHIYKNENYIPMGFTFDQYITEEQYYNIFEAQRSEILVSNIVLTESQAKLYGPYLSHNIAPYVGVPYEEFQHEVRERRMSSAYSFNYDHKGFTAKIHLIEDNLVFFSVPYEKGWKAYVNGAETVIEKVDIGFMAVFAEKGINEIVFVYETPSLKAGALISAVSFIALIAYTALFYYEKRRREADNELMSKYYEDRSLESTDIFEKELSPEEDLTIVRSPEDVPPASKYTGPEEKIYPEL
ncbi:MAG: YfhO family protein [Oscillospiraceae bacterium]|nr:YfhO family protein [Oscillospiraceae bacterium]